MTLEHKCEDLKALGYTEVKSRCWKIDKKDKSDSSIKQKHN